ncbi:hypothetical protein AKO1_004760 [Acrasis kona]|uniref:Uncharacterized protein n=1 Tax=Acrasis kona TaxID=1008807 RepID=A0AAW2Z308_9EUKA
MKEKITAKIFLEEELNTHVTKRKTEQLNVLVPTKDSEVGDEKLDTAKSKENQKKDSEPEDDEAPKKKQKLIRKFHANGDISPAYNFYVDPTPWNEQHLKENIITRGLFMTLVAPSQSGKARALKKSLTEWGFIPIMVQAVKCGYELTMDQMLNEAGCETNYEQSMKQILEETHTMQEKREHLKQALRVQFKKVFGRRSLHFCGKKVVLIIDEIDGIGTWSDDDRMIFLDDLRTLKNERASEAVFVLQSVIVITNYMGKYLNTIMGSSFNVNDKVTAPYFSLEETKHLFEQYKADTNNQVQDEIIEHIHEQCRGAQGITQMLGKQLDDLYQGGGVVDFNTWKQHYESKSLDEISRSANYQKMAEGLSEKEISESIIKVFAGVELAEGQADKVRIENEFERHNICIVEKGKLMFANPMVERFVEKSLCVHHREEKPIPNLFHKDGKVNFETILCRAVKYMNRISIIKGTKLAVRNNANVKEVYVTAFNAACAKLLEDTRLIHKLHPKIEMED